MAGWLLVRAQSDSPLSAARGRSAATAGANGERIAFLEAGAGVFLAAWRRDAGEFPCSGRIYERAGTYILWVGQCVDDEGDASEAALALFALDNPALDAVAHLNGPFAVATYCLQRGASAVWTDRHGHYPIYLYRDQHVSVATTHFAALMPYVDTPTLDEEAAALLLQAGELVDRRTLLRGVELIPGGFTQCERKGEVSERRFWRMHFAPDRALTFKAATEEIASRLERAVVRIENTKEALGCPLSGGLDSRLILGLTRSPGRVPSFTWGPPACRDRTYAAQFAQAIGSPHHPRDWPLGDFPPLWEAGVRATAGATGVHEMFMLPFRALLAEHCDVTLNGLAGDVLLGGNALKRAWLKAPDLETLTTQCWNWRVARQDVARAQALIRTHAAGRALWESSCAEALAVDDHVAALQSWLLRNRISRFTNCGTMLLREAVESHAPFYDRDLLDYVLRTPLHYKLKHRLYLAVLLRACPRAGAVPWQRTALAPRWGFVANLASLATQRAMRIGGRALGRDFLTRAAVANVAEWFRTAWREPAEAILLSQRCLDRGWLNPDGVRSVWRAHQRGDNCTRQLGVMIAMELFARQFLDRVPHSTREPEKSCAAS